MSANIDIPRRKLLLDNARIFPLTGSVNSLIMVIDRCGRLPFFYRRLVLCIPDS